MQKLFRRLREQAQCTCKCARAAEVAQLFRECLACAETRLEFHETLERSATHGARTHARCERSGPVHDALRGDRAVAVAHAQFRDPPQVEVLVDEGADELVDDPRPSGPSARAEAGACAQQGRTRRVTHGRSTRAVPAGCEASARVVCTGRCRCSGANADIHDRRRATAQRRIADPRASSVGRLDGPGARTGVDALRSKPSRFVAAAGLPAVVSAMSPQMTTATIFSTRRNIGRWGGRQEPESRP